MIQWLHDSANLAPACALLATEYREDQDQCTQNDEDRTQSRCRDGSRKGEDAQERNDENDGYPARFDSGRTSSRRAWNVRALFAVLVLLHGSVAESVAREADHDGALGAHHRLGT